MLLVQLLYQDPLLVQGFLWLIKDIPSERAEDEQGDRDFEPFAICQKVQKN